MTNKTFAKYSLAISLQVLLCYVSFAQDQKVAGLKRHLPTLTDTSMVDTLNAICSSYININTDSALHYATQARLEAERINYGYGKAVAFYNLGMNERITGTYPAMEKYLTKAVALLENVEPDKKRLQQLAKTHEMLGLSKWAQGKFDEALLNYKKAVPIALEIGEENLLGALYSAMGVLETERGQYKNSLEYCMKGLPLWRKPGSDPRGFIAMALLYNSVGDHNTALDYCREAHKIFKARGGVVRMYTYIGETFYLLKEYDSAIYCYRVLLDHNKKLVSVAGMNEDFKQNSWVNSRMAEIHIMRGQYDSAIYNLKNALIYFEGVTDRNQVMWTLLRLVRAYQSNGNRQEALYNAHRLLRIATETGARQYIRDAHFILYKIFDAGPKYDSAYRHLQLYTSLKEIIDTDRTEQKLAFFRSEIESKKAQADILKLKNEKELQELQLRQYALQRYLLIVCIVFILAMAIIVFRNILLKRKAEKQRRELAENELKMQAAENAKAKAEAIELEMQALRAQMNPHFIFNSLNSINRFILQNNSDEASEYLIKFSKLVRLILQNTQVPWITLEGELESLELYLELESLRMEKKFSYNIKLAAGLDVSAIKIPPLIIQPYAENAIWHGLAHNKKKGHLEISITEENDYLIIIITDDGVGREKSALINKATSLDKKSLGSKITAHRIAMVPGNSSGVTINDLVTPEGTALGTEVIIKISVQYD